MSVERKNQIVAAGDIVKARDSLLLGIIAQTVTPEIANLVDKKFIRIFKETGERAPLIMDLLDKVIGYYVPGATIQRGRSMLSICLPPVVAETARTAAIMLDATADSPDTEDLYNKSKELIGLLLRLNYRPTREEHKGWREDSITSLVNGVPVVNHGAQVINYPASRAISVPNMNADATADRGNVTSRLLHAGHFISAVAGDPVLQGPNTFYRGFRVTSEVYNGTRSEFQDTDHPCLWAPLLDLGTRGLASEVAWIYVLDILKEIVEYSRTINATMKVLNIANPESEMSKFLRTSTAKAYLVQGMMVRVQLAMAKAWSNNNGYGAHRDHLRGGARYVDSYTSPAGSVSIIALPRLAFQALNRAGLSGRVLHILEENGVPLTKLLSPENLLKMTTKLSKTITQAEILNQPKGTLESSTFSSMMDYVTESKELFTIFLGEAGFNKLCQITQQPIIVARPEVIRPFTLTQVNADTETDDNAETDDDADDDDWETDDDADDDDGETEIDEGTNGDGDGEGGNEAEEAPVRAEINLDEIEVTRAEPVQAPAGESEDIAAIVAQLRAEGAL